ncbi:MAG: D-3-phosphoglycerate dehydrogenase, partial [uncultured Nocardioidaceae bacterium]
RYRRAGRRRPNRDHRRRGDRRAAVRAAPAGPPDPARGEHPRHPAHWMGVDGGRPRRQGPRRRGRRPGPARRAAQVPREPGHPSSRAGGRRM